MKAVLSFAVLAAVLLGGAVSGAEAQAAAPAPEVRITGFLDTITSWNKNFFETLIHRTGDTEWYVRNRGRLDIVGVLGSAKAVLGL